MRYAILCSTTDPASMTIKIALEKLPLPSTALLHTIDTPLITAERIDETVDADVLLFASRHAAKAGRRSLTCHVTGNFGESAFGGKTNVLSLASGSLLRSAYLSLKKATEGVSDIDVSLEATHHGPLVEKPHVFMEVGSTEEHWTDEDLGRLMASAIVVLATQPYPVVKTAIALGGTHYCAAFNKVLERTAYGISHVLPKYDMERLDEAMLRQMIEKTVEDDVFALLDWKGLKEKDWIVALLEHVGVTWRRSDKLLQN